MVLQKPMKIKIRKNVIQKLPNVFNDIVLVISAIIALVIAILDFSGALDKASWISGRVTIITLLCVGFLLINNVVERRVYNNKMQQAFEKIVSSSVIGAQYIDKAEEVVLLIERIIHNADECIMAIGAKSRATRYLKEIEEAIEKREIKYYRLLDGEYITHELHKHIDKLLIIPSVEVAWTPREKFGNLVVTDKDCLIVFPGATNERFSGLWLPGNNNSRKYNQYFLEAYSKCIPIHSKEVTKTLCISCSMDSPRNLDKISRMIEKLNKEYSERTNIDIPEINL